MTRSRFLDEEITRPALEALAVAVAALSEEMNERAAERLPARLASYDRCSAELHALSSDAAALSAAMIVLGRRAAKRRVAAIK